MLIGRPLEKMSAVEKTPEKEEGESKGEGAGEGAPGGGEAKVELSDEDKEVKGRVFPEGKPPKEVMRLIDSGVRPTEYACLQR